MEDEHGYTPPEAVTEKINQPNPEILHEATEPLTTEEIRALSTDQLRERYPERFAKFVARLGSEKTDLDATEQRQFAIWARGLNNLDAYIAKHHEGIEQTLRGGQIRTVEKIRDFLETGDRAGYIKLPARYGKTVIFSEVIEAMDLRTVVATSSRLLVEQTAKDIRHFGEELNVGMLYTHAKEHDRRVVVTTYDSLRNGELRPEDIDLLILDEAHRALGEKTTEAVAKFDHAIRLGFTATPRYSQEKELAQLLPTRIHTMDIPEAIDEGMLASFSMIVAETNTDISEVRVTSSGTFNEDELAKAINVAERNQAAVNLYQELFAQKSALAFCVGIAHAAAVAETFTAAGISAAYVFGKQDRDEQRDILTRYATGEIKVLCSADLLTTGYNEPRASVCLNLSPTLSPVVAEQRGSRVLTLDDNNSEKHAYIVDFLCQTDKRKHPITFYDIVGERAAFPHSYPPTAAPEAERIEKAVPKIEGLRVTVNPTEVARLLTQRRAETTPPAQENWKTIPQIAEEYKIPRWAIDNYIDDHLYPGLIKEYAVRGGQAVKHLAPELVDGLRAEFLPPTEWVAADQLASELNLSERELNISLATADIDLSQQFGNFYVVKQSVWKHFITPELADWLRQSTKIAAEIAKLGVPLAVLPEFLEQYRLIHPDWFIDQQVGSLYTPELLTKIHDDIQHTKPTEDMLAIDPFIHSLRAYGTSQGIRAQVLDGIQKQPDQAAVGFAANTERGTKKIPTALISAKLAQQLRSEITELGIRRSKKRLQVLYDWETIDDTIKRLKTRNKEKEEEIRQFVYEMTVAHPELYKIVETERGEEGTDYTGWLAPEVVRAVMKKYGPSPQPATTTLRETSTEIAEPTPADSVFKQDLEEKLGIDEGLISQVANKYRKSNPEWFRRIGARTLYAAPLVDLITKEVGSIAKKRERLANQALWVPEKQLLKDLATSLGFETHLVRAFLRRRGYKKNHPDWCDPNKKTLAPELVALIKDETVPLPPGWLTPSQIARQKYGNNWAQTDAWKTIDQCIREHRELLKRYPTPGNDGQLYSPEYCSPELVTIILQRLSVYPG